MSYIDCTDGDDFYEDDRPGMYGGGDIEPDFQDYATDNNYCIHGQYIGTPWGADYICGYCEDGVSAEEFAKIVEEREAERQRQSYQHEGFQWIGRIQKRLVRIENLVKDEKGYIEDPEWAEFISWFYATIITADIWEN